MFDPSGVINQCLMVKDAMKDQLNPIKPVIPKGVQNDSISP